MAEIEVTAGLINLLVAGKDAEFSFVYLFLLMSIFMFPTVGTFVYWFCVGDILWAPTGMVEMYFSQFVLTIRVASSASHPSSPQILGRQQRLF